MRFARQMLFVSSPFFWLLAAFFATALPLGAQNINTDTQNNWVTHNNPSYLKELNASYGDIPDLATHAFDYYDSENKVQKVNEFKITHYVKQNTTFTALFPTVSGAANRMIRYQRFYNYDKETDVAGLEARIKGGNDNINNGLRFYKYMNGLVTGDNLWPWGTTGTHAQTSINYKNTDGKSFTLAVDVSRYNDLSYESGNLQEPSLNMRYIYYMKDAKEMADALTQLKLTATPTVETIEDEKFYEEKEIHFPQIENMYKNDNSNLMHNDYQGEFLGLRHTFQDYWVYSSNNIPTDNKDSYLINLANNENGGTGGNSRIEVVIYDEGRTGINLANNTKGYYLFKGGSNYNVSRFLNFRYPNNAVTETNPLQDSYGYRKIADSTFTEKGGTETKPAYVCCYLKNGSVRYKVAKFKIIFDKPSKVSNQTLPWSKIRGTNRDPRTIQNKAGIPVAKISFDNPEGSVYKDPNGNTFQSDADHADAGDSGGTPLLFGPTNYAFYNAGNEWGEYSLVTKKYTRWGSQKTIMPANDPTYGTGRKPAAGMTRHFMYIDASEQPGDICSVDFEGDFCSGDQLMCTGWIAGTNVASDGENSYKVDGVYPGRCPGSVTVTVKAERKEPDGTTTTATIKRYCPGNAYAVRYVDASGTRNDYYDQWHQFYFEFSVDKHYDRYWLEVNNNSVSSSGADFCLDDIEVFCLKPDVDTEMNSILCMNRDGTSDLKLLKLTSDFNEMLEVKGQTDKTDTGDDNDNTLGLVFLKKEVFLTTFREEISKKSGNDSYNENKPYSDYANMPLERFEELLDKSFFDRDVFDAAYKVAFDAALLGNKEIWDSNTGGPNDGHCVMNFHWHSDFKKMDPYNFTKAVNKTAPVYGQTGTDGRRYIVLNGNFPGLKNWEPYVEYYIVTYNEGITDLQFLYSDFNLRSECKKRKTFHLDPPAQLLGMEDTDSEGDMAVCEGTIPTVLTDLKGLNDNGEEVPLTNLNFDWWTGDNPNNIYATLDNYHYVKYQKQADGTYTTSTEASAPGVTLSSAISLFRIFYPDNTSLIGVVPKEDTEHSVYFTQDYIDLLHYLVQKGQLYLHTKSVNVAAKPVSPTLPYFYLVASPIHDDSFKKQLHDNNPSSEAVFYCEEPQGLRIKVSEKAPTVSNGFADGTNHIGKYEYPAEQRTLSLRLAKRAQFDVVRHGRITTDAAISNAPHPPGQQGSSRRLPTRISISPCRTTPWQMLLYIMRLRNQTAPCPWWDASCSCELGTRAK